MRRVLISFLQKITNTVSRRLLTVGVEIFIFIE